jgi:hypothetical protein
MKAKDLFESSELSVVKMVTQGIRHVVLNPKNVDVEFKKISGAQKKQCFNNAFKSLSVHPDSKYVLGYVFLHNIPIEHAWIKEGDKYFDVTLDPTKHEGYISVAEFSFDEVMEYVDKHSSAPSLYDINRFLGNKK